MCRALCRQRQSNEQPHTHGSGAAGGSASGGSAKGRNDGGRALKRNKRPESRSNACACADVGVTLACDGQGQATQMRCLGQTFREKAGNSPRLVRRPEGWEGPDWLGE